MKKKYNLKEDLSSINDIVDIKSQIISIEDAHIEDEGHDIPESMPILALRGSLIFPGSITPITIGREKSIELIKKVGKEGAIIGTLLQKDINIDEPDITDLNSVGTAVRLLKVLEMPSGHRTAILHGLEKIEVVKFTSTEPYFTAEIKTIKDADAKLSKDENLYFDALIDNIKDIAVNIVTLSSSIPKEASFAIKNMDNDRGLINFICSNIELPDPSRQQLLEAPSLKSRAELLFEMLVKEQQLLRLKNDIQQKVKHDIDAQQREYFLQQQLRTIQEELGGGEGGDKEITDLLDAAENKKWSVEVSELFYKELSKLERMNPAAAEYSVQINYLQLLIDLPWDFITKDNLDLAHAQKRLDQDHYGLEEVKDRIVEYLAVLKLKGDLKSPIICLYGAPGVGKTSLGKSVAKALKRKFGRISLGGLHDESEIRGHRKTYIGAMPGRIIQTIKKSGSSNPVIILDEIDKVTRGTHGDPSSALLEVLDPEQNTTFHDNYLDIEYDLSKVMFIATANDISSIPIALRDRMEMIHISGYLMEEKVQIALGHLIPKQIAIHGLTARKFKITANVLELIISNYTRESGVRTLDKLIAKLARNRAKQVAMEEKVQASLTAEYVEKVLGVARYNYDIYEGNDYPGVVTGLAWTEVGGDILFIESSKSVGKGNLTLTGNLGNVMKESASIALEWVKAHSSELGIDNEVFDNSNIHIHVPEGAIPKDGPSAGITMVTSIVSLLTNRKVKERIAMTGETTLRGKVLPVGGLKEKLLAAKRAGITDIIVSEQNKKDVADIKQEYLEGVTMHYASTLGDVLDIALLK